MVNIKKIRWIPILMVLSQVMLAGFVAYWLKSQYQEQKDILHDDLSRIYDESLNQVMDSVVFSRVVEPALNDTLNITIQSDGISDTAVTCLPKAVKATAFIQPNGLPHQRAEAFAFSSNKQDMLIRSVKLIINRDGDSIVGKKSIRTGFPLVLDSVLFRKFFAEKIGEKFTGISLLWYRDSVTQATHAHKPGLYFSSMMPDQLPGVLIKNEGPYLIRRMSAQILFALILLLLTGSAFFFTNRSLKRQVILNSLRNDFVSNITHELKTPVSTVKVALEALKTFDKVSNPAVTRDYLDMAGQELNRLDQLISKVLDQSLIGEQNQVIQTQPSDLKKLIHDTLLTLQPRLVARNATVNFDHAGIEITVNLDPLHVQGVLINLIDNSLKYGPEKPEILIRLWQDNGSAYVAVSDNGPGIPKEYLDRVFDKFFRVPTGNTHNIKGYGLGLSFAALVMEQHQGSISVKNLQEGGCAFTLRFPRKTT